ncbi:hypothetical protein [Methylohalobius crimeensis]|uniref:hypothetical protein n=1 Tax=Methylohalobius crimeensis TaxID=244365 RepID=UPI0003B41F2B|nr:hypothetical protein [Methylohalobius crimeensis]
MQKRRGLKRLVSTFFLIGAVKVVSAAPSIGVFLDKNVFEPGEEAAPSVSVTGQGDETNRQVDVYLGLIAPDGTIYQYPGWKRLDEGQSPWLSSFDLPGGYHLNPFALPVDMGSFPDFSSGQWQVAAALTEPGTFNIISVDFQPLVIPGASSSDGVNRIGFLSINDTDDGDSGRTQAAFGFFMALPGGESSGSDVSSDDVLQAFQGEGPGIDQCGEIETSSSSSSSSDGFDTGGGDVQLPTFLDAGDPLTITAPAGQTASVPKEVIDLPQFGPLINYRDESLPPGVYQDSGTYTFSGPGGADIGEFSTSLNAPAPLTVTAPDLSGTGTLNTSDDLPVTWNGNGGQGVVNLFLSTSSTDFTTFQTTTKTLHCRFADDGSGVVPASLLGELAGSASQATILVERSRMTSFDADGLDFGVYTINTGVSGALILQ